ncbi:MAG: hypothetical protein V4582_13410 [Pseudomonadota bacterium]
MKNSKFIGKACGIAAIASLAAIAALTAHAQAPGAKSIAVEHAPAFPAFNQWVTSYVTVQPEAPVAHIEMVPFTLIGGGTEQAFQPQAVIVGLPDLPLIGEGALHMGRNWGPHLNYQGVHMALEVISANGNRRELRPMGSPVRAGERFKVRMTATFDAVAQVDQVVGDIWYGSRTGQVYPQAGMSVQMRAGETVRMPLGANEFFVMNRAANERLVMAVRHARAVGEARSDQPAYRQDGRNGSDYLQLVPRGKFPSVEQLVANAR